MRAPSTDLNELRDRLAEINEKLSETAEPAGRRRSARDTGGDPVLVAGALMQLFGVLDQLDGDGRNTAASSHEINTLGEYGLHLLDDLATIARQRELDDLAREVEHMSLPWALLIARNGGEIRSLATVVDTLAHFANQPSHPTVMGTLYAHCCELVDAASPAVQEDLSEDPTHPWRLLLLNRAIFATRSHNPRLIGPAYDAVVEWLPDDARRFFSEAMEQVAVTDYPAPVRELVRRYFLAHAMPRHLH
jgi:hypothetical protein